MQIVLRLTISDEITAKFHVFAGYKIKYRTNIDITINWRCDGEKTPITEFYLSLQSSNEK